MNEYLNFLEKYKDFKEISDIVDEVRKLRVYYHTQQYDKMQQHINKLTSKYLAETYAWNTTFSSMPATVETSVGFICRICSHSLEISTIFSANPEASSKIFSVVVFDPSRISSSQSILPQSGH